MSIHLITGNVKSTLLKFTFPILLSILLQTTYGTVDLLIVGLYGNVTDVSGVTIGSQLMQTMTSVFSGFSMASTILLGQSMGKKNYHETSKIIGVSIALFTSVALLISLFVVSCNGYLVQVMQTPTEAISQTKDYLFYTGIGVVFIVYYNLLGSIFRGIGDSKTPLYCVFIACIINIILDLYFVAYLNMGAKGAALATMLAQTSSVLFCLIMISYKGLPFKFDIKDIGFDTNQIKSILTLGIPIAIQGGLVSISFLAVTAILNTYGVVASAAVGIVEKITSIVMLVPMAFSQSISAFTAQNYGAKEFSRMNLGLKYSVEISLLFGVLMAYLGMFHGEIFTQFFTHDVATTQSAILYLKAYSIDTILVCFLFCLNGYFNGCGQTKFVMFQSVLSAFLIRIPLAYFISNIESSTLFEIGLATPASTFIQIIACFIYYQYIIKNSINKSDSTI